MTKNFFITYRHSIRIRVVYPCYGREDDIEGEGKARVKIQNRSLISSIPIAKFITLRFSSMLRAFRLNNLYLSQ